MTYPFFEFSWQLFTLVQEYLTLVDAHLATSQKVVELALQTEATARQQEII
jgi:hypothetical protein